MKKVNREINKCVVYCKKEQKNNALQEPEDSKWSKVVRRL